MSERMSGPAQAEANAAATIAANEAEMLQEGLAMDAQSERDAAQDIVDAYALNRQIDQGAVMAKKIDDVEARRTSPDVQAMNQAADMEIFGSRGRTQGYVDEDGQPLTAPIPGIVDTIRGTSQAAEIRKNPRYGTKESDRNAAADAYEAHFKAGQGERDAKADRYVEGIEELQEEGFELSQAKLITDLASEIAGNQQALFDKLMTRSMAGRDPSTISDEEASKIRGDAVQRVTAQTVRRGDDVGMLKRIIKDEGLFNREEYEKFRYKRGNEKNGERKEFARYHEQLIDRYKNFRDNRDRNDVVSGLVAKDLLRQRVAEAEAEGRGDGGEEPPTELLPISDPTPKGIRGRVRHVMARAAAYVGYKAQQAHEYFNDDEKGRRRKVVAGVAGAVIVGGLAYLELKGISSGGSHGSEATVAPSVKPHHQEAVKQAHEHVATAQSTTKGNNGVNTVPGEHVRQSVNGGITVPEADHAQKVTELKPGQNPWTVSDHRLHELGNAHPSAAQIEHFDKEMAHLNPEDYTYGGDSSESIPAGTVLKLPR